ncbi:hypothetical protein VNO78_14811 [Psophocarpus tetragonolobus]|uniref:Uncharacterized protein n=1 Tax=Psophocarpus tetragonolobus TaxID=3891 RepID=A0AAN9XJ60_PSOTE
MLARPGTTVSGHGLHRCRSTLAITRYWTLPKHALPNHGRLHHRTEATATIGEYGGGAHFVVHLDVVGEVGEG